MDEQLRDFLGDLVTILKEKYNDSLYASSDESAEDKSYRLGSNFAYFDVLDLVQLQLSVQGFDPDSLGKISPVLGEKI